MAQLLAQGWGAQKVHDRYMRYATPLHEQGVTFAPMRDTDRAEVRNLTVAHINGLSPDWQIGPDDIGIVTRSPDGALIAALLMSAYGFEDEQGTIDVASMIRSVVVEPRWRGTGAGVVTLGLAHVPFSPENRPSVYMGNCAAVDVKFYQRLGYTVLQPGEAFAAPFMGGAEIAIGSEQYPCLFFKEER